MLAAILSGASLARAHWKLVGLGLLCLAIAVLLVINGQLRNKVERRDIRINELVGELKRISEKRNTQRENTEKRIEQAERGNKEADNRARKIEEAPLPGNCVTPPEIIGADI
jgi:outer membrane murein-binding lipoprotein Lpp